MEISNFDKAMEMIFGRWKSQILYVGVKLGIFDYLKTDSKNVEDLAKDLNLDENMTYRLLRSLASLNVLREEPLYIFSVTSQGELFRKDNPNSLRGVILLEEGPQHYQIWKHLSDMIKDGKQNAFTREYSKDIFEFAKEDSEYGQIFNEAMSSYSRMHTNMVLEALENYDFSNIHQLCDIGGGQGHLLCNFLSRYPHMRGTILELESVVNNQNSVWPKKLDVEDRFQYVKGNMFEEVPTADAYFMKMILHDWNDEECKKILSNLNKASSNNAKVFIIEHLVPDPHIPHFSKFFDIHMMCATNGKERTISEFSSLLLQSGWKNIKTHHPGSGIIGIIEGIKNNA